MLGWSIFFFVLTLLAAVLGFGGVTPAIAGVGQAAFVVFLIAFALCMRREHVKQRH